MVGGRGERHARVPAVGKPGRGQDAGRAEPDPTRGLSMAPISVAFDMTFANRNRGGSGAYARSLVDALREQGEIAPRVISGPQRSNFPATMRWLREHHQPVPEPDAHGSLMPGMDHPTLMPGMLTPGQLAQLDSARGPEFDRLFLTFMIQHHRGALTMVRELVDTPGAARDGLLFQIASDVSADQTAEIDRMTRMLAVLSQPLHRAPRRDRGPDGDARRRDRGSRLPRPRARVLARDDARRSI